MAGRLCVLTPTNRILPCCLALRCGLDQLIGNLRRVAQAVKVPDVQVVGVEFLEAGVELRQDARPRTGYRYLLARKMSFRLAPNAAPTMRSFWPPW